MMRCSCLTKNLNTAGYKLRDPATMAANNIIVMIPSTTVKPLRLSVSFITKYSYPLTIDVILNIGRNMHMTIEPMTSPRNAIMSGSIMLVRALTAASTCSS